MYKTTKSYFRAIAALAGTSIGAGIFGVPYVMAQAGALVGVAWVLFLGFILIITNLLHGEFSLRSRDDLKFVGIARKYLDPFWGKFTGVLTIISFYGSLLAYVIIGGEFLDTIISGGSINNPQLFTFIYFALTSLILLKGISFIENLDLPLVGILFLAILGLVVVGAPKVELANLMTINFKNIFLPYGVVLFSLASVSAIPAVEEILDHNKKKLRQAIIWAGVISMVIVLAFGLVVVGITGQNTSPEAISGLSTTFGDRVIVLGAVIGFFAVLTSHLIIAHHLREIFVYDYNLKKGLAWLLVILVPYLIYLIGNVSFIGVLGFVGGVIGGVTGNLVGYISLKSHKAKTRKPEYCIKYDNVWARVIMVVYTLGIIYQLYYSIFL